MIISRKQTILIPDQQHGKTPKELQEKLARMGLEVDEHHFYTSALATPSLSPVKVLVPMSLLSGNLDYTTPYMKRASPWMTPLRIML